MNIALGKPLGGTCLGTLHLLSLYRLGVEGFSAIEELEESDVSKPVVERSQVTSNRKGKRKTAVAECTMAARHAKEDQNATVGIGANDQREDLGKVANQEAAEADDMSVGLNLKTKNETSDENGETVEHEENEKSTSGGQKRALEEWIQFENDYEVMNSLKKEMKEWVELNEVSAHQKPYQKHVVRVSLLIREQMEISTSNAVVVLALGL